MALDVLGRSQAGFSGARGLDWELYKGAEFDLGDTFGFYGQHNLVTKSMHMAGASLVDDIARETGQTRLTKEELWQKYPEHKHLFSESKTPSAASYLVRRAKAREGYDKYMMLRRHTLQNNTGIGATVLSTFEKVATPTLGFIFENMDPTALVPAVGQTAKGAAILTKLTAGKVSQKALTSGLGTFGGRVATGAAEGTVGGLLAAPVEWAYAEMMLNQSGLDAGLASLYGGAIFGTSLGATFGGYRHLRINRFLKQELMKVGIDPHLSTKDKLNKYAEHLSNNEAFLSAAQSERFFSDINSKMKEGVIPSKEELFEAGKVVNREISRFQSWLSRMTSFYASEGEEAGGAVEQGFLSRDLDFSPENIQRVNSAIRQSMSGSVDEGRAVDLFVNQDGSEYIRGLVQRYADVRRRWSEAEDSHHAENDTVDKLPSELEYKGSPELQAELVQITDLILEVHNLLSRNPELSNSPHLTRYFREMGSNSNTSVDRDLFLKAFSDVIAPDRDSGVTYSNPTSFAQMEAFIYETRKRTYDTEAERLMDKFLSFFGRELVISPYLQAKGAVTFKNSNRVVISQRMLAAFDGSARAGMDAFRQTAGHEFYHTLELLNPKVARFVVDKILQRLSPSDLTSVNSRNLRRYKGMIDRGVSPNNITSEFMADLVGELISKPKFWETLDSIIKEAPKGKRAGVKSGVNRWLQALSQSQILSFFTSHDKRVSASVDDLIKTLSERSDEIKDIDEALATSETQRKKDYSSLYSRDITQKVFKEQNLLTPSTRMDQLEQEEDVLEQRIYSQDELDEIRADDPERAFRSSLKNLEILRDRYIQRAEDVVNEELVDMANGNTTLDASDYEFNNEKINPEARADPTFIDEALGDAAAVGQDFDVPIVDDEFLELTKDFADAHKLLQHPGRKIPNTKAGLIAKANQSHFIALKSTGKPDDVIAREVLQPNYAAAVRRLATSRRAGRGLAQYKTVEEKLDALVGGYTKTSDERGAGINVAREKQIERNTVLGPLVQALAKNGMAHKWDSLTDDSFIRDVMEYMERGDEMAGASDAVKDVATALRAVMEYQGKRLKALGLITDTLDGYTFKTTHNRFSILEDVDGWINDVMPRLNWEEIGKFHKVATEDDRKAFLRGVVTDMERAQNIEDYLQGVKDETNTPEDIIELAKAVNPDRVDISNDAIMSSIHRSLRFLPGEHYNYDLTKYGSGNPAKKILTQLMMTADTIIVREKLGFDLDTSRADFIGDSPRVKMVFDYISGLTDHPVERKLGKYRRTLGQVTDLALLWKSGLTSALSDPAHMVSTVRWLGTPTKDAYQLTFDMIKKSAKRTDLPLKGNTQQAIALRGWGAGLDAWLNAASRRFGGEFGMIDPHGDGLFDSFSRKVSDLHSKMFLLNQQAWVTTVGQEAMVDIAQQTLADIIFSGRIDADFQHVADRFQIKASDLSSMRDALYRDLEGTVRVDPNDIADVELQLKVKSYMDEVMRMGVIEPDARTEAYLRLGFREGTKSGVAIRLVTKYMGFSMAQLRQTYPRMLSGYNHEKAMELAKDPKALAMTIMQSNMMTFIGMSIIGAAARQAIVDLTNFKEPVIFNTDKLLQILQRSDVVPLIGDVAQRTGIDSFLGDDSLYGFGGPTVSMLTAPLRAVGIPFVGDDATMYGVANSALGMTPGATIPFWAEGRKALMAGMFDGYNQSYQKALSFQENMFDQTSLFKEDKDEAEE